MRSEHVVRVYDASGLLSAVVQDFTSLTYTASRNGVGMLDMVVPYSHAVVAMLQDKALIEVWRRVQDVGADGVVQTLVPWTREGVYLYRESVAWDEGGLQSFRITATTLEEMLAWRIVAYPALSTGKSRWTATPTETIMRNLVAGNLGVSALISNGRYLNGLLTYSYAGAAMAVGASSGAGLTRDWFCEHRNLLQTIQELADGGGVDFDVVRTGALAFEFRTYAGQRGNDRTASVVFSLPLGNMADPSMGSRVIGRSTLAVIGGDGPNDARPIATYELPGSTGNQIEAWVDARGFTTTAALVAYGASQIGRIRPEYYMQFKPLQTPSTLYGLHYFLGDKVTGIAFGLSRPYLVSSRTVRCESTGAEVLEIGLTDV